MREDSDPEKRRMKGQTEVKHEILKKYLNPWLMKITEISPTVRYIDGFAGWGRYEDGSPGSPIIAMNVAKNIIEGDYGRINSKLYKFNCSFVEDDDTNFEDLLREVNEKLDECPDEIGADCHNTEFEEFAEQFLKDNENAADPSFIFIDPFGFSGLSFEVVKNLLNLRTSGTEVFISFVAGEMARFLESSTHASAITEILGTDRWKSEIDPAIPKEEKAEKLLQIYEEQLRDEAEADYVWPFRMSRESKDETVYYLIHATNHFDGFKLMKDIMYNAGAEDRFAYLGPNHYPYVDNQESLGSFTDESEREIDVRVENLSEKLYNSLEKGRNYSFMEIIGETYQETSLIEKHYRKALYLLEDQDRADIINHPEKPSGTKSGLNDHDEVKLKDVTGLEQYS